MNKNIQKLEIEYNIFENCVFTIVRDIYEIQYHMIIQLCTLTFKYNAQVYEEKDYGKSCSFILQMFTFSKALYDKFKA